jgi:hypothetical protein
VDPSLDLISCPCTIVHSILFCSIELCLEVALQAFWDRTDDHSFIELMSVSNFPSWYYVPILASYEPRDLYLKNDKRLETRNQMWSGLLGYLKLVSVPFS